MNVIDSFQYMSSSLEKLVDNLAKEGPTQFHHMAEYFGTEKIDLRLRKQIYPYEYHRKTTSSKERMLQLFIWRRYFSRRLCACTKYMGIIRNTELWAIP
jgi:hypothetical protein